MANALKISTLNKRFLLSLLGFNALYFISVFLDTLFGEDFVGEWNLTPYLLSYDYGFIRRAFIGSVLKFLNLSITPFGIFILYTICVEVVFILMLIGADKRLKNWKFFNQYLLLLTFSPALALHFGDDRGRTDVFLLLITVLGILYVRNIPLLFFLSILGFLIHEGFLLMGFNLLVFKILKERGLKYSIIMLLLGISFSFVLTLSKTGVPLIPGASEEYISILKRGVIENLVYFYGKHFSDFKIAVYLTSQMILSLIFLLINLTLYIPLFRNKPLALVPLTTLLMFFLGIDYFRWVSITVFYLFLWVSYNYESIIQFKPSFYQRLAFYILLISPLLEIGRSVILKGIGL